MIDPGFVGIVSILVTAVIAVITMVRSAKDSRDRSRPYVTAKFVEEMASSRMYFVVENFGQSAAYNVNIEFDGALSHAEPNRSDYGSYIRRMYQEPGLTFGPGDSRRSVYMNMLDQQQKKDEVVAPDRLTGTIRYFGPGRRKQYCEAVVLDLTGLRYRVDTTRRDRDVEQRLKRIGDRLGDLRKLEKRGVDALEEIAQIAVERPGRTSIVRDDDEMLKD